MFPQGLDGWSGPSVTDDNWLPVYHGAIEALRTYSKHGHELHLYIGYYPLQRQGSEVISDLNRISESVQCQQCRRRYQSDSRGCDDG